MAALQPRASGNRQTDRQIDGYQCCIKPSLLWRRLNNVCNNDQLRGQQLVTLASWISAEVFTNVRYCRLIEDTRISTSSSSQSLSYVITYHHCSVNVRCVNAAATAHHHCCMQYTSTNHALLSLLFQVNRVLWQKMQWSSEIHEFR